MDSKVRIKAIATIVTTIILILVVVYMVNERQLSRLFRRRGSNSAAVTASTDSGVPKVSKDGVFGEQIGDDLKAFLKDDSFFDGYVPGGDSESLNIVSGEVDPNAYAVLMSPKVLDRSIVISLIDEQGRLVTGEGFVVEMNGLHLYKDDDRDGVIYIEGLSAGTYELRLQQQAGFKTQTESVTVEVN